MSRQLVVWFTAGLFCVFLVLYVHSTFLHEEHMNALMDKDALGFIALPGSNVPYPGTVAIATPPYCTRQTTLYAIALAAALRTKNINVTPVTQGYMHYDNADQAKLIEIVLNQPAPQVYVNGRMKGHPTLEEIIEEIQLQKIYTQVQKQTAGHQDTAR